MKRMIFFICFLEPYIEYFKAEEEGRRQKEAWKYY